MDFLPIFIIAMPQSNRTEIIRSQLTCLKLSFTIQKAIEGKNLTEDQIAYAVNLRGCNARLGYKISKNLVGCGLSHIEVYKKALASRSEWVLVLEEDAILINFDKDLIYKAISEVGDCPSIIQLFSRASRLVVKSSIHELETDKFMFKFNKRIAGCGASSYLINRKALEIALNTNKLNGTPDWPSWGQKVKFFGIYPWLFKETSLDTTMPMNSIRPMQNLKRRLSQLFGFHYLYYRKEYENYGTYLKEEILPYFLYLIWRFRGSKFFQSDPGGIQII